MMQDKIRRTLISSFFLLVSAVIIWAITVPFGAPLARAAITTGDIFPAVENLVEQGFQNSYTEFWSSSFLASFQGFMYPLFWFALCCVVIGLFAFSSRLRSVDRNVEHGILGSQRAITSSKEIIADNAAWNGKDAPAEGIVVGNIKGQEIIIPCVHACIVAPSGSGKTRGSVYQTIDAVSFTGQANLLITDPSLEIWITTHSCLKKRSYNTYLLDFEDPRQGSRWNPLALITQHYVAGDKPAAEDRARSIGSILFPSSGGDNAIFDNAAAGIFASVAYVVATHPDVPDNKRHLWSVVKTIFEGTKQGTAPLKKWLLSFDESDSPVATMAATFLSSEGKLESSILSSLHDGLQPFTSQNMRWLTSGSDLDIDEMIQNSSAVFIHTLDPGSSMNRVASLFFDQHWAEVQRLGKRRGLRPCWIIGDEWHSIPKFNLVNAIEKGRKYGLHYIMYTQSFSGYDQYKTQKEDGKDAILANCKAKVLYSAGSDKDAAYFEKLGGYKTVRSHNQSQSRNVSGKGSNQSYSETKVPVWPQGNLTERNPYESGVLVIKASSDGVSAGKYEVPVTDVSKTFTAEHFGTIGTREFEHRVAEEELDRLEDIAQSKAIEVEAWCPEFEYEDDTDGATNSVIDDEFSAWDR